LNTKIGVTMQNGSKYLLDIAPSEEAVFPYMQAMQKKTDHTYKIKIEYCECTHNPLNTKIGVTMQNGSKIPPRRCSW
jgi:hypothetical protein